MRLMIRLLGVSLLTGSATLAAAEMRGLLVFGHEARSFRLCGDTRDYWLHATGALREQLEAEYRRNAKRPYEAVYAELEGTFGEHPASGFAADYDGTIEVRALRSVSRDGIETCRAGKPAAADQASTYVFLCDDQTAYTVRATGAAAWIFRPQGTLRLSVVPTTTGMKYADSAFELRIDGQQAQLGESGGELLRCRNDRRRAIWERAKLDGADFRAVGNEPGWHLEIREGSRIVLVADYGAARVERPLPPPVIDQETRTTRWDAGDLILEVIGRPCSDTMSGQSFEAAVVVTWEGRALRGCGRALH